MSALTILANYRGENADDYHTRLTKDNQLFIDTGSHGYLCLGSEDNGYSDAIEIARRSNYSFILDTLVYLEEDCDMPDFYKQRAITGGDL